MVKALYIAWKNFTCKKGVMIKLISCFFVIVCSVSCFFNYIDSTNSKLDTIIAGSAAKSYVGTESLLNNELYPEITEIKEYVNLDLERSDFNLIRLKIDDKEYEGADDFSYDFDTPFSAGTPKYRYSVPLKIDAYNGSFSLFTKNELKEYKTNFGSDTPVLFGDLNLSSGQIIISDYMLERFGIIPDDSLIGSKLSLYNSETEEIYCSDLELSCILNSDIFRISSAKWAAQILISIDDADNRFDEKTYFNYTENFVSAYDLLEKLSADHIPTSSSRELYYYKEIYKQNLIVTKSVSLILLVFLIALIVSIFTVLYFYYINQLTYRRMLLSIGMKENTLFLDILFEISICLLFAFILAFIIGGIIMYFVSEYLESNLGMENMFSVLKMLKYSSITVICSFCIAVIFSVLSSKSIKKLI